MTLTNDLAAVSKAIRDVEALLKQKLSRRRRTNVAGMLTVLLAMRGNLLAQLAIDLVQ